jgi:nicotinate-nucleotide adenylyltransferase
LKPIYTKNRVVGLLGGSFNPAHGGHLHITLHALKKCGVDTVWWLVSPRNPLKDASSLAAYEKRLASAQQVTAQCRRIHVSDIERRYRTRYSYQTIAELKQRYPGTHFVWLMGADNLPQFHRWRRWRQLVAEVPVVVFDRAPYSHTAQHSQLAVYMRRFLRKNNQMVDFSGAPAFHYVHLRRNPLSATSLRKMLGERAFLGHNEGVEVL